MILVQGFVIAFLLIQLSSFYFRINDLQIQLKLVDRQRELAVKVAGAAAAALGTKAGKESVNQNEREIQYAKTCTCLANFGDIPDKFNDGSQLHKEIKLAIAKARPSR